MSTSVTLPTEDQAFDPKAHFAARNAADEATRNGKEDPKPAEKAAPAAKPVESEEQQQSHLPRSARREMNRLREQAAEERGRRLAIEDMISRGMAPKATEKAVEEDPEPQRAQFATDVEYQRAAGRWDARQEALKVEAKVTAKQSQADEIAGIRAEIEAAETQAQSDIKDLFPDWDEVSKAAAEDDDAPEFIPADHPMLMMLIARSDVKARILYHFAKEPDDLEAMLALTKNPDRQIAKFHRLEGKVEKLYDKPKAAQASGAKSGQKERTVPEKAEQAMGASERDARKPRPSAEVAARGGSAPPEEPAIGSAAWMAKRNQATGGR